jgi:hypothetical protein
VKTAIIALSAAALIAAAPAVFGQGSKTPSVQHNVSKCLSEEFLNHMNHL